MKRSRPALLILATVLAVGGGFGVKTWRDLPDPIEDARSFLAPYDETWRGPSRMSLAGESNMGFLARRAWLADEERRMRAILTPSRGWTIVREKDEREVVLRAAATGPSRWQRLRRRLAFLPAPTADVDALVMVEISPHRPLASEVGMLDRPEEREGWTTARVTAEWRPYPFTIAPTLSGVQYSTITPMAPGLEIGREIGEDPARAGGGRKP